MNEQIWLETILKKRAYENSPVKILDYKNSSAVGKNENYLSLMTRVEATVLFGSGKTRKVSVVVKENHKTDQLAKFTQTLGVFLREITMYRDVLPKVEDLMRECGINEEPMWAECYDVRLYDRLVFEDLAARGFYMSSRQKQLSLDAALLVMKNLAKLHGLSHVLLKRGEIPLEIFGKNPFLNLGEHHDMMYMSFCKSILVSIDSWGDDWKEIRKRFENAIPSLNQRAQEAMKPTQDDFVVLSHGDCWTNNILFRNGNNSEKPEELKFVDWQISFTTPVSYDIEYFLVSSVPLELYHTKYDLLIQTYSDSLNTTMQRLNYKGTVPNVDDIKRLIKRTHILYLYHAIFITPTILGKGEDIPDLEEALSQVNLEAGDLTDQRLQFLNEMHQNLKGLPKAVIQEALRNAATCGLI